MSYSLGGRGTPRNISKAEPMQTLTQRQRLALEYVASVYRFPPKARLASWHDLLKAGLIQGPRFACSLTPAGRAAIAN